MNFDINAMKSNNLDDEMKRITRDVWDLITDDVIDEIKETNIYKEICNYDSFKDIDKRKILAITLNIIGQPTQELSIQCLSNILFYLKALEKIETLMEDEENGETKTNE